MIYQNESSQIKVPKYFNNIDIKYNIPNMVTTMVDSLNDFLVLLLDFIGFFRVTRKYLSTILTSWIKMYFSKTTKPNISYMALA